MTTRPTLFLIDGSSYMYRAFFALPHLSNSSGVPTNAVYGFTAMLLKVINEYKPEYLAIMFDTPAPTFRHEVYQAYKANRPEMPDSLIPQIPYIKAIIEGLNIPVLEKEGFEADDIIGTIAHAEEKKGMEVVIISGDKDFLQLVSTHITVLDTMKDKKFDIEGVIERFGVPPEKTTEVLGLMGDSSDNVPGVPGIGEKTAAKLIEEYGSIANLLKNLDHITAKKIKENLITFGDQALLSKQLVTLDTTVPLHYQIENFKTSSPHHEKLKGIFKELEFTKFLKEFTPSPTSSQESYQIITTEKELLKALTQIRETRECAFDLFTTSPDPMRAELAGIALTHTPHQAFYIPLATKKGGDEHYLQLTSALMHCKPLLEDQKIKKYGHNCKHAWIIFKRHGSELRGIVCDTMVASYLLNPSKHSHSVEDIALEFFDHRLTTYNEIAGSGKHELPFYQIETQRAMSYGCERSDLVMRATQLLLPKLSEEGFDELFHQVELPLLEVLATMEMNGVKIDTEFLKKISREFESILNTSMERIYQMAGEEFNINSPQQLGKILFEKLKLPGAKKTKTGYSTDISVLTSLAATHPLPAEILGYRSISKLKTTYVDALPILVNPDTGRIHTSYNQTVTATGRLSSSNPNLQNIPIRSEEGKRIREAFIAEPGWYILSADYSQIELRILAHLSQDQGLREAFTRKEDIHTRTAAEIFGLSPDAITPQMRREAKVINFGIIYGMSSYGLAKELGISPKAADAFITNYFQKYQGVKTYIDSVLEEAKKQGYVTTLMKRRRYLPEINSKNLSARQFAERTAINTPIQGTASDLIKVAMVAIDHRITREELKTKMIIQVHDELVFEVPESELEAVQKMVKEEMEEVVKLSIPLEVDVHWGKNWSEAH